jgi:hypothetical protein
MYYSWSALHVSGDVFHHYQEHLTLFTVSGSIHPSSCRLVSKTYVKPEAAITVFELLMMGGVSLETC